MNECKEVEKIDTFSTELTLAEANSYMEEKLVMQLYEHSQGFFGIYGSDPVIRITGVWSEDDAIIEFDVRDGEFYATNIKRYSRNFLHWSKDVEFHIPRIWLEGGECFCGKKMDFDIAIQGCLIRNFIEDVSSNCVVEPVVEFCKDSDLGKYEGYAFRKIRENLIMRYEMFVTIFPDKVSNALLDKMNTTEEEMYGLLYEKYKDRPLFLAYDGCGEYYDCDDMACASCPMHDPKTVLFYCDTELSCATGVDCFLMPGFYMSSDELLSKVLELRDWASEMYLIVGSSDGIILTYCDGESVSNVANYMRRKYNKEIFVFRYEKDTV